MLRLPPARMTGVLRFMILVILTLPPVRLIICYIDGDEGILHCRGYPIEEFAESSSVVEVAYLLMYGNLPTRSQLAGWEFAISQHSAVLSRTVGYHAVNAP